MVKSGLIGVSNEEEIPVKFFISPALAFLYNPFTSLFSHSSIEVSTKTSYEFSPSNNNSESLFHVVAIDFGAKRNILRCLSALDCKVTVLPATTDAETILSLKPDGIFLSNGPGDPAATGEYAVPMIQQLLKTE